MSLEIQVLSTPDAEWDCRLKSLPNGSIYQSSYWAKVCKAKNKQVIFLIAESKNKILGQMMLVKEIYSIKLFNKKINVFTMLNSYYSPCIFGGNKAQIVSLFLSKLNEIVLKDKISLITIIPYNYTAKWDNLFKKNKFVPKRSATFVIQLNKPIEELWVSIKKSCRKNIKKTSADGIIVSRASEIKELKEYEQFLLNTRKKLNLRASPFYPDEDMWKENRQAEVFLARKGDEISSALGILAFNRNIIEIGAAHSRKALRDKIYSNDLLKWEIIKWGNNNSYLAYDLAGVNPHPTSAKEIGIFRFKEKWGGELRYYNSFTKIYNKARIGLITFLRRTYHKYGSKFRILQVL